MINTTTIARLLQVESVTEEEVPEIASLAAPSHGISVAATPIIHSSLTARTGLPFSSFRPFPRM